MKCYFLFSSLTRVALGCLLVCCSGSFVSAQSYIVQVTNVGNSDFSLTPMWFGFHSGGFDVFNPGSMASPGLELVAEEGDVSGLQANFSAMAPTGFQGVLANAAGFPGAPVIEPNETASGVFNFNGIANPFFNYASMVIPSNDAFIGNPNATQVLNPDGTVIGGTFTINIFGNQIWDGGTEVNNGMGAAFSLIGGTGTTENGVVALLPAGGLDNFIGTATPAGTINVGINPGLLFARIEITAVPEPSSLFLLTFGCTIFQLKRRKV